jgi:hypothetical protein
VGCNAVWTCTQITDVLERHNRPEDLVTVSPKRRYLPKSPHGVTTENIIIITHTALRTWGSRSATVALSQFPPPRAKRRRRSDACPMFNDPIMNVSGIFCTSRWNRPMFRHWVHEKDTVYYTETAQQTLEPDHVFLIYGNTDCLFLKHMAYFIVPHHCLFAEGIVLSLY